MKIVQTDLITLFLAVTVTGCNPPSILISRGRPFHLAQIRRMAIIPFYGDITDCAKEAHLSLESTLYNYFTQRGIQMVPVDMEVVQTLPDVIGVTGILTKEKARQIGSLFEVDAFISGSISQCYYYRPEIGEGMVYLTLKIYDGISGDLLLQITGQKTVETSSGSISRMTIEIVDSTFEIMGWK
jgi:hypothetical protein